MLKKRMTWWKELRWLAGTYLFKFGFALMEKEMAKPALLAFSDFMNKLENDPAHDTEWMKPGSGSD